MLRAISIASRRSLGNTSLVTMAVTANNRAKSGTRYNSPSGCSIDNGTTVQSEATQARTTLSVTADPTAPFGSNARHAIVAGISATPSNDHKRNGSISIPLLPIADQQPIQDHADEQS